MKSNGKRQAEIMRLISERNVDTQDQLRLLLSERGFSATQATISRDIKELQLVKELTVDGEYRYVTSERKLIHGVNVRLQAIFREGVTAVESARNLVVIKTVPGLASAAAAALDAMEISEMVGSLAGDDTAFLVMRTDEGAQSFCHEIREMLN